jgi:hypothetical protein
MPRHLEEKAQRIWSLNGQDPSVCMEVVALGFEDPIDETITWFELPNTATVGTFRVEPEDLRAVLEQARTEGFVDPEGLVYIWHSHYIAEEPSDMDIEHFPSWLCDAGLVYHTPSGGTRVYNQDGVLETADHGDIYPGNHNPNSLHATSEV